MGLISPDIGTIFWMVLAFGIVFLILKRFAWGPILSMLKTRETNIQEALSAADKAREEMALLQADHEKIMQQARAEREEMISEARKMREEMIEVAKTDAEKEADKLIEKAKKQIENEKLSAIVEIKQKVSELSVEIAEKILRTELQDVGRDQKLINNMLDDLKMN